ncbi:DUF1616 domain-containing protein [Natronorubrum texcoconense]|uniref:Uncharacterized membrane protein n=1 Tax=Natronorubrum texcoconense TaxID=1095776 RepID=A0A1G9E8B0_9EURY|nr:DUF1616 domain-containing protein [Natronorubrum texcoconense]SDK72354.1 Uncharacterized membrane protein [Natronorubrum texcoconense]
MIDDESRGSPRARGRRSLPVDLVAVATATVLVAVVALASQYSGAAILGPLAVPSLLFAPGYVAVSALFPERDGLGGLERLALSVGLSLAIVPVLGLGLAATPWGVRLVPLVLVAAAVTLLAAAVATVRRRTVPEDERFRIPVRKWIGSGRRDAFRSGTRGETALTLLLVVSALLVVGTVGYAAVTSPEDESYSAIYLLTEDEDGELVADEYPAEFEPGEEREVIVGIDNHEHRPTEYTVVVAEQAVDVSDGEVTVDEQRELERFDTRLEHGETRILSNEFEPTMSGSDVRIVWLLYLDGDVPDDPSVESADYYVSLWGDASDEAAD